MLDPIFSNLLSVAHSQRHSYSPSSTGETLNREERLGKRLFPGNGLVSVWWKSEEYFDMT
jgi:hypothetical protein